MKNKNDSLENPEVTVIGGGLAGLAASIHLAKAGMRVLCLEPDSGDKQPVGESLDWSAPDLLKTLGLPMEWLIEQGIATYKRHVILKLGDGSEQHYIPSEWLARPPYNIELRTMHLDRTRLNDELRRIVLSSGVTLVQDRVTAVEKNGKRVTAVTTALGARIASPWFLDASGSAASLFPREFNLPYYEYGPRKVAMWAYFDVPESSEGTTLYAEGSRPPYMEWIWEIPIHTRTISVGYVSTGESVKEKRQRGLTVDEIYQAQLRRFPRFEALLRTTDPVSPSVTSFVCRAHSGVAGPNWLVIGEAASMVDPMTANGVTAALRHAAEASSLILRSRNRNRLPYFAASMYSRRVLDMARFFNSGIEKVMYDSPIRNHIGVLNAGDVYTVPAWSLNSIYTRLRPRGVVSTLLFGLLLNVLRVSGSLYHRFCKRRQALREVTA